MEKRGSIVIYSLMVGLVIIILALALAPAVQDFTDSARNETTDSGTQGLNCSSDSISNFDKATCVATDLTLLYFIGGVVFIGGAIVGSRIFFGGSN